MANKDPRGFFSPEAMAGGASGSEEAVIAP